jgi:nicotinamidase-related amidase
MSRALVVIDVQESFRQRPNWQAMGNQRIAEQVARLVEAARRAGDPVVWVLHAEPGSGTVFDPVRGYVRLIDGLVAHDNEPQIMKTSVNAFTTTNLHQQLTQRGVREVTICGIRTEQCCETTTRHASDIGHTVDFVSEATLTFAMTDAHGRTWSADEIKSRSELVLDQRFARIATVEQALAGPAKKLAA